MRGRRRTRVQPSQWNRAKRHPKRTPNDFYAKDAYCQAIHRAVDRANREGITIPAWHPNQLRHSAATEIRKAFGLEAAQTVLGHSKANTTEMYAERDGKLAAEVARRIG